MDKKARKQAPSTQAALADFAAHMETYARATASVIRATQLLNTQMCALLNDTQQIAGASALFGKQATAVARLKPCLVRRTSHG